MCTLGLRLGAPLADYGKAVYFRCDHVTTPCGPRATGGAPYCTIDAYSNLIVTYSIVVSCFLL